MCQSAESCSHALSGSGARRRRAAAGRLAEQLERERKQLVAEARPRGARRARSRASYGKRGSRPGSASDESVALRDDDPAIARSTAMLRSGGGSGSQTSCECVCGRLEPGCAALVTSACR